MIEELEHEHAREIPAELPKAGEAFMIRGDPFLVVGHHCWYEAWYVDIVWLETGLRNSFHKSMWLNMAWEKLHHLTDNQDRCEACTKASSRVKRLR